VAGVGEPARVLGPDRVGADGVKPQPGIAAVSIACRNFSITGMFAMVAS
jgi:hypothetical protein